MVRHAKQQTDLSEVTALAKLSVIVHALFVHNVDFARKNKPDLFRELASMLDGWQLFIDYEWQVIWKSLVVYLVLVKVSELLVLGVFKEFPLEFNTGFFQNYLEVFVEPSEERVEKVVLEFGFTLTEELGLHHEVEVVSVRQHEEVFDRVEQLIWGVVLSGLVYCYQPEVYFFLKQVCLVSQMIFLIDVEVAASEEVTE